MFTPNFVGFDLGGFENELDDPCLVSVLRSYDCNTEMVKAQGKEISADVYFQNGLRHIDGAPPTGNPGCRKITGIRQNIGNIDALPVEIGTSTFNYVELLAMLLAKLKRAADVQLNDDVKMCCIAIPSFFTDIQRRAVHQAAEVADLIPLRLLHECTAVALSYGMESKNLNNLKDKHVLVLNVDKNTMQACVAKFIESKVEIFGKRDIQMEILAHAYSKEIGEKTFEDVIYEHWNDRIAFEKWKIKFLTDKKKQLEVPETIVRLENISAPLRGFILKVLHEAHLKPNEIKSIILAGSGTQYPQIPTIIEDVLGRKPERWTYATAIESVAKGCAMHCFSLIFKDSITENDTSKRKRKLMKFKITEKFPSPIWMQIKNSNDKPVAISIPKGLPSSSEVVTFHTTLPCTVDLLLGTTLSSSHQIGFVQASQDPDAIVELRLRIHVDKRGIDSVSAKMLYEDEEVATKAVEYVAVKNETSLQEPRVPSLYVTKLLYNALADDLLSESRKTEAVLFFLGKFEQARHRNDLISEEDKGHMAQFQPLLDNLAGSLAFRLMFRYCERKFKEIAERKKATDDFNEVTNKQTYLDQNQMRTICDDAKAWLKENPNLDSVSIRIKIQSIHDAYLDLNKKKLAKQQGKQAIEYVQKRLDTIRKTRFVGHFEDKFHGTRITFNLALDDQATVIDYFRMRLADNDRAEEIMGCRVLCYQLKIFGTENLTRFEIVGKRGQRPALYVRNDNLYITAIENGTGQIYELAPPDKKTGSEAEGSCPQAKPTDHTDTDSLDPETRLFLNSIILKCRCDYRSLVDYNPEDPTERDEEQKKLLTELYIKRFIEVLDNLKLTEECVDFLWKYNGDPAQYKELIQTLMTCAITICETARFRIVYDAVFKGYKCESKLLMYVIWNWKHMSTAIRNSKTSGKIASHLVQELRDHCGVEVDMETIAKMLYLVLNCFLPLYDESKEDDD